MRKISQLGLFLLASLGVLAMVSTVYPAGRVMVAILAVLLAYLLLGLVVILAVKRFLATPEMLKP